MNKVLFLSSMILVAATLYAEESTDVSYKQIQQNTANEIIQKHDNIIILDVRTKKEFNSGHIKNAVCVPVETIDRAPKELPDKNQTILVYCRSGRRSKIAAQKLSDLGYTDIREFGGINTWKYGTARKSIFEKKRLFKP